MRPAALGDGQSFDIGGDRLGQGPRDRRRRGRRRRRLQVRGPRPARRVGRGRAAAQARRRASRSCSKASRTRPARSSSPTARPSGMRTGRRSSPSTRRATSSPAWSPARSRAGCWSTSASTSSCRPARWTSAGRRDIGDYIDRDDRVHDPQDRRGPAQHRRLPPQAASRITARAAEEDSSSPRSSRARSARASSRTSPTSARSSTSAASTACCTSPTWAGAASTTRSDMVKIDQQIEVMILHVDKEKREDRPGPQAARRASPWENVADKYPVGSRAHGRGRQRHDLRRLRQARAGHRGPGPHLRDVLDQADQPPERAGAASATRSRSSVLSINQDKQEISPGHEADPGRTRGTRWPRSTRRAR